MKKFFLWILCLGVHLSYSQVDFTADTTKGCAPFAVNFQAVAPNAVSWLWNLGGGTSSTLINPSKLYNTPGQYTITLTVTDANGQTFSISKSNYITSFAPPQAALSASRLSVCVGENVVFTDQSILGNGNIKRWLWDFGDGNASTQSNPSHTYAHAGTFGVSLTVTDTNGCQDIELAPRYITVKQPDASFSVMPAFGCFPPFNTQFSPQTTTGTHSWFFGDGNTSTASSPSHTYNSVGSFDVMHIVQDAQGCKDTVLIRNAVDVGQSAGNILVSQNPLCPGESVSFSVNGATISNLSWDFGDGSSAGSGNNISHAFFTPGNYWVKATFSLPNGCQLRDSVLVDVRSLPQVAFYSPDTVSCKNPHHVQFFSQSPTAVTWDWQFGNGLGSKLENPTSFYLWTDSFDVQLIITDSLGCENEVTYKDYVKVGNIIADFVANPRSGCAPLSVQFYFQEPSSRQIPQQRNVPGVSSYSWNFGDGFSSTLRNPAHTYQNPGLYTIRLIVTNLGGCSDTLVQPYFVRVGDRPTADFIAFPDTGCSSDIFSFSNQSTGVATSYSWFFGDGDSTRSLDAAHIYKDTGTFVVKLIAEDRGCKDTMEKVVYVLGPVAAFYQTPSSACDTPALTTFVDYSNSADSWHWTFGDGSPPSFLQNPPHTYFWADTFAVRLIAGNSLTGCYDTAYGTFLVSDVSAKFSLDTAAGCAPLRIQFSDSSVSATSFRWFFGDGTNPSRQRNPAHIYKKPGIYTVILEVQNNSNCTNSTTYYPVVIGGPSADFMYSDSAGCAPHEVQFADQSSSPAPIASWLWDLDNGISTQRNAASTYNAGVYDISLIVTDTLGCRDTLSIPQLVHVTEPVPDFIVDYPHNCPNNPISFTNTSLGQGLSYLWQFGDGNSSTLENPTHSYSLPGTYSVTLTIKDQNDCDTSLTLPNHIFIETPAIGYTADSTFASCPPLPVNFAGFPISTHNFTTWRWNFGNVNTGFQQNVTTVYTQPGIYSVYLSATAPSGCKASEFKLDLIHLDGPSAAFSFTPRSGCPGTEVRFVANGTRVSSWQYDMDDGTLLSGQFVSHIYHNPGVYWPRLSVFDSLNCQVVFLSPDSVRIFTPPVAAFSQNSPYVCDSGFVNFTDLSQATGNLTAWQWDFGDGNMGTGPLATHYYNTPQTYPVTLIVTDNNSCQDTIVKSSSVRVVPSPEAKIFPLDSIACPPFKLTFSDISPPTNSPIISRLWNFGFGGQMSTQIQDSATYPNPGTYHVQFTLTDSFGCSKTTATTVTVRQPPQPDFTVDRTVGCAPLRIQFTDLTTGPIVSWFWDFGDGKTSTVKNPTHIYARDSSYSIRLVVTDVYGCVGEIVKNSYLNLIQQPTPIVDAGPPFLEICEGDSITLPGRAQNTGANLVLEWTPAIGLNNYNLLQPKASPGFTTTYFFVAYSEGCPTSNADSIRLIVRPRPTISPGNDYEICEGDSATLDGTAGGVINPQDGYHFSWTPTSGLDDPSSEAPRASPAVNTTYTLQVTSSLGCVSDPHEAKVILRARPKAEAGPDFEICYGDTAILQGAHSFTNTPAGGETVFYNWQPKDGLAGSFSPKAQASPGLSTKYTLTVSYLGCTSMDSMQLAVQAVAQAQASSAEAIICEGESLQLIAADSISPTASYLWLPPWGLDDARSPKPLASPDSSISYALEVKEGNCVTRDTISLRVYPVPKGSFELVPMENCEEYEVEFFSEMKDALSWIWDFGDGSPPMNGEYVSHIYAEEGSYDISLTAVGVFGCESRVTKAAAVVVPPRGEADFVYDIFSTDSLLPLEVQFWDRSRHAVNHYWDFGDGFISNEKDPLYTFRQTGDFYPLLKILDQWGCWRELQQGPIAVREKTFPFIPNIITPNNDGVNDFFPNWEIRESVHLEIFDRWGRQFFLHDGVLEKGWNGTDLAGNPAVEGVYFYVMEIEGKVLKGNVTLLR